MMNKQVHKLKERATLLLSKRKYRKVIKVYDQIAQVEPSNPRWPLKRAEAYRLLGKRGVAVKAFREAVQHYIAQGYLTEARAICNVILGLQPEDEETQSLILSLNTQLGQMDRRLAITG